MIIPMTTNDMGVPIWPQMLNAGDRILIREDASQAWNSDMDKYRGRWLTILSHPYVHFGNYKYVTYNAEEDGGSWNWHSFHVECIFVGNASGFLSETPPNPGLPMI